MRPRSEGILSLACFLSIASNWSSLSVEVSTHVENACLATPEKIFEYQGKFLDYLDSPLFQWLEKDVYMNNACHL